MLLPCHRKYSESDYQNTGGPLYIQRYYPNARNKIVCDALSIVEYPSCHMYFLSIHTRLKSLVYTDKIQVTRGIFILILKNGVV